MIHYSHTEIEKNIKLRLRMKMHDDVPKLPITYRDSPVNCTDVVAIATVIEYLPS